MLGQGPRQRRKGGQVVKSKDLRLEALVSSEDCLSLLEEKK